MKTKNSLLVVSRHISLSHNNRVETQSQCRSGKPLIIGTSMIPVSRTILTASGPEAKVMEGMEKAEKEMEEVGKAKEAAEMEAEEMEVAAMEAAEMEVEATEAAEMEASATEASAMEAEAMEASAMEASVMEASVMEMVDRFLPAKCVKTRRTHAHL